MPHRADGRRASAPVQDGKASAPSSASSSPRAAKRERKAAVWCPKRWFPVAPDDVDDQVGATPTLVLVGVDQERDPADLAQLKIVDPRRQFRLGHGTRVELYIPRVGAATQTELDLSPSAATAPACDVLLVEDHPAVRAEVARLLGDLGCRVTAVEDAEGAMDALAGGAAIDLMITDIGLPHGLDGRALAEVGRSLRPDLKTLFTSGYGAEAEDDFLPKPFGRAALAAAIQRQFARPAPKKAK